MASRRGLILSLDGPSVRVGVSFLSLKRHRLALGSHLVTRWAICVRRGLISFTEKAWPRVEALPFPLRWHPLEYEFTCYRLDEIRIVLAFSFGRIIDIDSM